MKPDSMGVSMFGSKPGGQATRTVPLGSAMASAATTAAAYAAAAIDPHCSSTPRPTAVIRMRRVDRSIKRTPHRSSGLATRLLSEGLVTVSARCGAKSPVLHDLGEGKEIVEVVHWKPLLSSFGKRYVLDRLSSRDFVAGPDLHSWNIRRLRCYGAPALGRCVHLQRKERTNMNQPAVNSGAQLKMSEATLAIALLVQKFTIPIEGARPVLPSGTLPTRPDHSPAFDLQGRETSSPPRKVYR